MDELNKKDQVAFSTDVDAADWNSQAEAFSKAVGQLKRIDYVYPIAGIGERVWTPNDPTATSGFVKPDLSVIDIDLTGLMYTVSLALQQFRRQEVGKNGTRGKSEPSTTDLPTLDCSCTDLVYSRLHRKRMRHLLRPQRYRSTLLPNSK